MRLPAALSVAVLVALSASGCSGGDDEGGFERVTARLHNEGQTSMTVPFTITADGKAILSESIAVAGGATVERTVDAVPGASYVLHATYRATSTQGSSVQEANGSRTHTLEHDDCPSGTVVVTFEFTYTSRSGGQTFNSGTSYGECSEGA